VLSNSAPEHEPFIPHFDSLFDVLQFSHRTGRRKPRPESYVKSASELGVLPSEVVFIDDKPRNLGPASELGMTSLHYRTVDQLTSDLVRLGVIGTGQ
jgi:putative hydrolase of the HAD superfamily